MQLGLGAGVVLLVFSSLTVTKPNDALPVQLDTPGSAGVVVFDWIPALTAPPIFNHFISLPTVTFGTHYQDYQNPVLRFTVGGVHHLRTQTVRFQRNRRHNLIAFWRRLGDDLELGVFLDGRLVGYSLQPYQGYTTWKAGGWIGARNLRPVDDPTFPGVQHADGKMENFAMVMWP